MTLSKALFSFEGRATRTAYWLMVLFMLLVVYLPSMIYGSESLLTTDPFAIDSTAYYIWGMSLPFLWPALAIHVKRWHDLGLPGYCVLLNLIPVVSLLAFICVGFFDGDKGPNAYGRDPRGRFPDITE